MNTKLLIGVVLIIVIAAGAYLTWGKGGGGYGPSTEVPVGGNSTSLQQLVAKGSPVTCTFSTTTASGSQSGTIYISGSMIAGDFIANDPKTGSLSAHMIMRDDTSYTWTSASSIGFKSAANVTTQSTGQGGVGYSQQMDYSCQAWTPDSNKFTVPSNINFLSAQ